MDDSTSGKIAIVLREAHNSHARSALTSILTSTLTPN